LQGILAGLIISATGIFADRTGKAEMHQTIFKSELIVS